MGTPKVFERCQTPKFDLHAIARREHRRHLGDRGVVDLEVNLGGGLPEIDPLRVLRIFLAGVVLRQPVTDVHRGLGAKRPVDLWRPTRKLGRQLTVPPLAMVRSPLSVGALPRRRRADPGAQGRTTAVAHGHEIFTQSRTRSADGARANIAVCTQDSHHVSFVAVIDLDLCDILSEVDSPIGIEATLAFPLVEQLDQLTGLIC